MAPKFIDDVECARPVTIGLGEKHEILYDAFPLDEITWSLCKISGICGPITAAVDVIARVVRLIVQGSIELCYTVTLKNEMGTVHKEFRVVVAGKC